MIFVKLFQEMTADEISVNAMWNRVWLEIKGLFSKKDDVSIIEECKKGDDETIIAYDTILQIGDNFLPSRIYNIITNQRKELGLTYQALLKFHEQQVV